MILEKIKVMLATTSKHKVAEVSEIIKEYAQVYSMQDSPDVEETGKTFIENSVIKAVTVGNMLNQKVMADDSGLCIKALDGFPGIYSARYMSDRSFEEKMQSILTKMDGISDRQAYFACAATFYDPVTLTLVSYEARIYGNISIQIMGNGGFGYDPIFIPQGETKSFGQLPAEFKNKCSHRAQAFTELMEKIKKIYG